jgi:hypothetical protein
MWYTDYADCTDFFKFIPRQSVSSVKSVSKKVFYDNSN